MKHTGSVSGMVVHSFVRLVCVERPREIVIKLGKELMQIRHVCIKPSSGDSQAR